MPPKQTGKGGNKKENAGAGSGAGPSHKTRSNQNQNNREEELQRDPLQAVVLADAFSKRLEPLTCDKPACLLPLCNVPLIDWTLENLALADVEEIFILSCRQSDQIKKHLATSPMRHSLPKVTTIATPDAQSLGDVMRELDSKQVIRSDFILIHADSVANMDLASIVDAHKRRRKRDKDAIMTICTMPVGKKSRTRNPGNYSLYFIEPTTSQLVHYAPVRAAPRLKYTTLPLEIFDEDAAASTNGTSRGAEIDIRNDLVDCGIDICSADVPPLFSENFDYQTLRRDFVLGILTSDLLESKIFVHVAPTGPPSSSVQIASSSFPEVVGTSTYGHGYAARVKSPADYDAVTRDVLGRWTHPLGPAGYLPGGHRYSSRAGPRFLGQDVVLSRTCQLGPHTLIGDNSEIGDKVLLHQTVVGSSVKVGSRSSIVGSYVWANSQIGAGCSIERSIVGENVRLLDGVKLGRGCIVADGCTVGPNVELPPYARVGSKKYRADLDYDSDSDSGDAAEQATPASGNAAHSKEAYSVELGTEGVGYLWPALGEQVTKEADAAEDEEDNEMDEIEHSHNLRFMRMAADLEELDFSDSLSDISSVGGGRNSDEDEEDDSEAETDDSMTDADSTGGIGDSMMLSMADGETNVEKQAAMRRLDEFRVEATASLERAFEESHTVDDAAIELKTLRMASNVPLREVRKTVVAFILTKCDPERPKEMLALLDQWCPLISIVAADDPIEALTVVQNFCAAHARYYKIFIPLLKKFYNDDIVSEESIVGWWRSPASKSTDQAVGGEKNLALRKAAEEVIRYILESQESSDDDESDDD